MTYKRVKDLLPTNFFDDAEVYIAVDSAANGTKKVSIFSLKKNFNLNNALRDGSNLDPQSIQIYHLSQEIIDQLSGQSFPTSERLGTIESLNFNFPDPTVNSGKWYDSAVTGNLIGSNAPSSPEVIEGSRIYSNGVEWLTAPPPIFSIPDRSIARIKLNETDDISLSFMEEFGNEALRKLIFSSLGLTNHKFSIIPAITIYDKNDGVEKVIAGTENDTGFFRAQLGQFNPEVTEIVNYNLGRIGGMFRYVGNLPILPLETDKDLKVIRGIDLVTGQFFGIPYSNSSSTPFVPSPPLENEPGGPLEISDRLTPKDINQILFYGESYSVGAAGQPAISTSQPFSNITWDVGPKASLTGGSVGTNDGMAAFKPLVEDNLAADGGTNRGETPCSGCANYTSEILLMNNGISPDDYVILSSTAGRGGYTISQLEKGSAWYQLAVDHIQQAQFLANAGGKTHNLQCLVWFQGANDAAAGIISKETYKNKLLALREDLENVAKSATSQTEPVHMLVFQMTYGAQSYSQIALAQYEASLENKYIHLITPTYHLPYANDNVHLNNLGYLWAGKYAGRAFADLINGKRPNWIQPIAALVKGDIVEINFKVPKPPLVLDTVTLANTQDFGFKIVDSNGKVGIDSVNIVNYTTVKIKLNRVTTGDVYVRYALDYLGSGLSITGGASGNLRDSTPDNFIYSGTTYNLYNVCPHFELKAWVV